MSDPPEVSSISSIDALKEFLSANTEALNEIKKEIKDSKNEIKESHYRA